MDPERRELLAAAVVNIMDYCLEEELPSFFME
jgi:hypothetical protein